MVFKLQQAYILLARQQALLNLDKSFWIWFFQLTCLSSTNPKNFILFTPITSPITSCYITMNILYFNILYNNCMVSVLMNYIHDGVVSLGIAWLDLSQWNAWMIEILYLNFTQNWHSCNKKFCMWFHAYAVT